MADSRFSNLFLLDQQPDEKETSQEPPARPSRYRILLVDDDVNVLKALKRVFQQENYEILTATSAEEGTKILESKACEVVITDYAMPGMNGAVFLRNIKQKAPDTVRILITGQADTTAVMAAIRDGVVYKFILKPWNDDDLRVTVALALEQFDLRQRNKNLQELNKERSKQINKLSRMAVMNRSQLAIILNKRGLLTDQQVQALYRHQRQNKEPIIKELLAREWVPEKKIREILRKEFLIDEVLLDEVRVDPAITALLPRGFCEKQCILPLRQDNKQLTLVMADPLDEGLINDLQFNLGLRIQAVMANREAILKSLADSYGNEDVNFEDLENFVGSDPMEGIEIVIDEDDQLTLETLLDGSDDPPAVRLANAIILEAIRLGASDIHIQPRTKYVAVRYRLDGILVDKIQIPLNLHMALVSRIKVMAELDITERRRPLDGRITVKTPLRIVDLRISTLPTINGEKIVMRVLDRNASVQTLEELGFSPRNSSRIRHVADLPQGIILATGPTGSGKTTTLYAMLQHGATPEKNYVTIEDPVEYYMDTAGQVLIRERIGLGFPTVLRATLRQDPDVVLVGEIRDRETAEVAFQAALTGHVVYSTLHTNSAIATIARLLDLGLKPYVLAYALEGIVAQRLGRRVCKRCKQEVEPDPKVIARLGPIFQDPQIDKVWKGRGCSACNETGYKGRVGIYEVLLPSPNMRHLIASGGSLMDITHQAEEDGLHTLVQDARIKVLEGATTPEEVLRVLGPQVVVEDLSV